MAPSPRCLKLIALFTSALLVDRPIKFLTVLVSKRSSLQNNCHVYKQILLNSFCDVWCYMKFKIPIYLLTKIRTSIQ